MIQWRQTTVVALVGLLLAPPSSYGQSFEVASSAYWTQRAIAYQVAAVPQAAVQPAPKPAQSRGGRLRIIALEGQRAANVITMRTATPPVVTVLDDNDRPVENASVTFQLPASGPGGSFGGDRLTYTTQTDVRGQAGVNIFEINDKPGRFDIQITASWQNLTGRLIVSQTNYMAPEEARKAQQPSRPLWKNWKFYAALAAAGVVGGVIAAVTGGGSPPVTVSNGPVVIGGPR